MKVMGLIEELLQCDDESDVVVLIDGREEIVSDVYKSGNVVIIETIQNNE
jgi:hypothetical protein